MIPRNNSPRHTRFGVTDKRSIKSQCQFLTAAAGNATFDHRAIIRAVRDPWLRAVGVFVCQRAAILVAVTVRPHLKRAVLVHLIPVRQRIRIAVLLLGKILGHRLGVLRDDETHLIPRNATLGFLAHAIDGPLSETMPQIFSAQIRGRDLRALLEILLARYHSRWGR